MKQIKFFGISDVGLVRDGNEDSFLIREFSDKLVLAVADGMGGAAGGQIASQTAVATIVQEFDRPGDGSRGIAETIMAVMANTHQAIRLKGETAAGNLNMGTTCTLTVLIPLAASDRLKAFLGHVGDSKLYQLRDDAIVQRSQDHSMLARMHEAGINTADPELAASYRHIITKSLGGSAELELDAVSEFDLEKGDILLLCSDGVSNYLQPLELMRVLKENRSLKRAVRRIVNLCKKRGGDDNITVILAEYGRFPRPMRRPWRWAALLGLILMLLVGLLFGILHHDRQVRQSRESVYRQAEN